MTHAHTTMDPSVTAGRSDVKVEEVVLCSVTASEPYQGLRTQKWNRAIIKVLCYTCVYTAKTCHNSECVHSQNLIMRK